MLARPARFICSLLCYSNIDPVIDKEFHIILLAIADSYDELPMHTPLVGVIYIINPLDSAI